MPDPYLASLPTTARGWMVFNLIHDINSFYRWGGSGLGHDCSGVAVEALWVTKLVPFGQDATAAGIHSILSRKGRSVTPPSGDPARDGLVLKPGVALFWSSDGTPAKIYHVAVALSASVMIEAGGGDSKVAFDPVDDEPAAETLARYIRWQFSADRRRAFVRLAPVRACQFAVDPFND